MRNRDNRIQGVGSYFHVYNRGNAKQEIFLNPEDYRFFISRLRMNIFPKEDDSFRIIKLPENSFSLIGYCLMPNHFHLLIRQDSDIPTSKLITKVCTSYSMFFNKKYDSVGHVFQDRFKQVLIEDNEYLKWLSCYIHQNPKVGGLTKRLEDYRWSSYDYYIKGVGDIPCESQIILDQFKDKNEYERFVDESYKIIKDNKDMEHLLID